MIRIALGIQYHGHGFHGWQAQKNVPTIQEAVQNALSKIADEPIFLHCAGRTDANVHALNQVVHFDTSAKRHIDAWIWGCNAHLPTGIVIKWAKRVDFSFHARFKAVSRRYRYIIYNDPIRSAITSRHATWFYYPLDIEAIRAALQLLQGEHDFSSFRSSQCQSKTADRCITDIQVVKNGRFIMLEIEANAFLHHMVRNIMGVLFKIGSGAKPVAWMTEVLQSKSRQCAAETAPPEGLYLMAVKYPDPYQFPVDLQPFLV